MLVGFSACRRLFYSTERRCEIVRAGENDVKLRRARIEEIYPAERRFIPLFAGDRRRGSSTPLRRGQCRSGDRRKRQPAPRPPARPRPPPPPRPAPPRPPRSPPRPPPPPPPRTPPS